MGHAAGAGAHRAPRLRTTPVGRVRSSEGWSVVVWHLRVAG